MENVAQQKSMLAQLLATENIQVVHDSKLETAGFDPIGRKLYLPVLKEMSGPVYDLFVLHEVSHALNTPADGFHNEKHPQGPRFKGFLNVVEDARIEKLIKRKYPGGRSGMINGYKKLLEMDFFGIRNLDPNSLPFVDRFNLYFKIGMTLNLKFSGDEMPFIERGMKLETWEDVEKLTNDLWNYAKDEELSTDIQNMMDDMKQSAPSEPEEGDEEEDGDGQMQGNSPVQMGGDNEMDGMKSIAGAGEETDEEPEGDEVLTQQNGMPGDDSHEEEQKVTEPAEFEDREPVAGGGAGQVQNSFKEHFDEDPISITDTNFRERESELADNKFDGVSLTAYIPEDDHRDYTIDYKTMIEYFSEIYGDPSEFEEKFGMRYSWGYSSTNRWYTEGTTRYQNFMNHNKPMVRHMVKEFEMRKSAKMHERSRIHQSGIINPSSLYKYKFDDRIFKAVTSTPEGKNHGLVFFIDCSGSMQHVFGTVIEQTVLMASFCQMVKIPFRIFGFTNMGLGHRHDTTIGHKIQKHYQEVAYKYKNKEEKEGDMYVDSSMRFYEFYNDKMTKREFQLMSEFLVSLSDMGQCPVPLSGTPLNEVIMLGIDLVNEFKAQYGLDICNTILLTDGDSSSGAGVATFETYMYDGLPRKQKRYHQVSDSDVCTYQHRKTGTVWTKAHKTGKSFRRGYRGQTTTENLLRFFEKCTGQNIIGINIFPKFNYYMAQDLDVNIEEARSVFRKSGYLATEGTRGYSKLFSVPNRNLTIDDSGEKKFDSIKAGEKTSAIARSFKSMSNKRKSQRMFLTEFVSMVS